MVDISEFFGGMEESKVGLKKEALLYYPPQCIEGEKKCKLQIILHGCGGDAAWTALSYTGWLPLAYPNDIVTLFPQTVYSCWETWATDEMSGENWSTNKGFQNQVFPKLVERLLAKTDFKLYNYYPQINDFEIKVANKHSAEYTGPAEGANYLGWGAAISTLLTLSIIM